MYVISRSKKWHSITASTRPSAPKQDLEVYDPSGMFMFKAGCIYTSENQSYVGGGESGCRKGKGQGLAVKVRETLFSIHISCN